MIDTPIDHVQQTEITQILLNWKDVPITIFWLFVRFTNKKICWVQSNICYRTSFTIHVASDGWKL